jgi:hypothetical protein
MSRLFELAKKAIQIAAVTLLLRYLAEFSFIQSFVLAFALVELYWHFESKRELSVINPFSVLISPKWYELLKDHGLVDDEKWQELVEESQKKDRKAYNLLRDGISFTVLQRDLIYSNNYHL